MSSRDRHIPVIRNCSDEISFSVTSPETFQPAQALSSMKRFLAATFLLASVGSAAWNIEDIPTAIQYNGLNPYLITTELTSAYRAIYNASGTKTSEQVAIAYRSKYMYVVHRHTSGWKSFRFDDNGRYPSIALDSSGKIHMSYYRSSNNKLYYARMVTEGTGNCGPNVSWACEEIPTTFFGAPKGKSAVTIRGTKVSIIFDVPGTSNYLSRIILIEKTIGSTEWSTVDPVSYTESSPELSIKHDKDGIPTVLIQSLYMDWYKKTSTGLQAVGPLEGRGDFDLSPNGYPRICYRDTVANRLIYAISNGTSYWTEKFLDYDIGSQGSCSIAIAPPGATGIVQVGIHNPRIAYYDSGSGELKYAIHPILMNIEWSVQTIATPTGTRKVNLHLDRQARPTVIYFDSTTLKLKLAK